MFEARLSQSVGWNVNPVLDRKLLEERVECFVAREGLIGGHDGVRKEAQAVCDGQAIADGLPLVGGGVFRAES